MVKHNTKFEAMFQHGSTVFIQSALPAVPCAHAIQVSDHAKVSMDRDITIGLLLGSCHIDFY